MNDTVIKPLAERFLKKESIFEWAIKCLEKGFDSKSLRMLASISNSDSPFLTDDYFNRTLKELNWENINQRDYLIRYAKILATEVIENKIDPINASLEIDQILIAVDYPSELHDWFDLNEIIWDYENFLKTGKKGYFYLPKEKLIDEIKKSAKELIKSKD